MIFKQINPGFCRSYLVASKKTREAVLIDPVLEVVDDALKLLRNEGLKLVWVMDTHTHADHVSGCSLIRKRTGVDYLMHKDTKVTCASRKIEDGETVGVGEITVRFAHVPGHTADSIMVEVPGHLLSGDFLFLGSAGAGRLDLPGGDVDAHYRSLRKLDAIPDDTSVWPAHDYKGVQNSTLKTERASNPVLSPRSRDEYLRWWQSLGLGPADWMKQVVKANVAGATEIGNLRIPKDAPACQACAPVSESVPECSPEELLARMKKDKPLVLDVRRSDEYTGELGHIHGSRLIPVDELEVRLGELKKDQDIVTVCRSGMRSARAAKLLLAKGFSRVLSMRGGMLAWNEKKLEVE